jgi:hypothetical protein
MTTIENRGNYFGGCPRCGRTDGYINVGRSHWFVCDEHRTKWCAGYNIFSSWRQETEEEQRKIYYDRGVDKYEEVTPLPDLDDEHARRMRMAAASSHSDEIPF